MPMEDIRVLIVDDSAVIRTMLSDQIAATPGMTVVGTARNGREAVTAVPNLHPHVITLDMQMPEMNGLTVLDAILDNHPIPIIMVSSLTRAGAAITLEALERGAADYVPKPEHGAQDMSSFIAELVFKIRSVASMDMRRLLATRRKRPTPVSHPAKTSGPKDVVPMPIASVDDVAGRCIALGISTGGPPALARLLESLRPPLPPMVIVQHMPAQFTKPLAGRLDSISALSVREASIGDKLEPNCVYLAPGGKHVELKSRGSSVVTVIRDGAVVSGHKPSADVMMTSAAKIFGPYCLGVIMTGMGRDGADGCRAIRQAGGFVLGQDEATSDVYGMNRTAYIEGNVDMQFGLHEGAAVITRQVRRLGRQLAAT